ncbi:MAG: hypothetical protein AAF961_09880 [Planctomycetota bacterium]
MRCLLLISFLVCVPCADVIAQENPFLPLQILAETTSPATGNRYQLTSMTTWPEAFDFAEAQGGWLWAVNDADEMNFVIDAFLPAIDQYFETFESPPGFNTLGSADDIDLYIGLTDSELYGASEGDFQWVNGDPLLFTNWAGGEPNNVGLDADPAGEDFGEIWNLRGNRTWNDDNDRNTGLNGLPPSTPTAALPAGGNLSVVELPPVPPPLNLQIDPENGYAQVVSVTDVPLELRSYTLISESGELDPAAWGASNLSARGVDAVDPAAPGEAWQSVNAATDQLYEAFLFGGSVIEPGETLVLGQVMQPIAAGEEAPDFAFEFASKNANPDIDSSVISLGVPIEFVGPITPPSLSLAADFNEDGLVDGLDLSAWESGFATLAGASKTDGDANLDGVVDGADFLQWQRQHGRGTASSGVTTTAVPEPAAVTVAILGCFACAAARTRRRG